jgi:hypothetical protein
VAGDTSNGPPGNSRRGPERSRPNNDDDSVIANSEDGSVYRWDLATNTLAEKIHLNAPYSELYTPTIIGPDGTHAGRG